MKSNKYLRSNANTFIEHFYLFGIDWNDLFNMSNTLIPIKETNLPTIKPKLLSKFPPINKPISHFNEQHCFPDGFELLNSNELKQPELFSFSLDNLSSVANYPKIYFTCLIIYEPFLNFELFSHLYLHRSLDENTKTIEEETLMKKNWVLAFNWFETKNKSKTTNDSSILIPKALCFSSLRCFPKEHGWLLEKIANYKNTIGTIPIEKIIENIVMEIPLPPRKKCKIIYTFPSGDDKDNTIIIAQEQMNLLLIPSYSMNELASLDIPSILTIFSCLLLEIPVLFFSSNKEYLKNIFETFLCLLYPFVYQYPHVSILPHQNYGIIEIYNSFAFGINKDYTTDFFETNNLRVFKKKILLVDIKNKKIQTYYQEDLNLPQITLNELDSYLDNLNSVKEQTSVIDIELPYRYQSKLSNRMKELFASKSKQNAKISIEKFNSKIKYYFYYFFLSILNKYASYLILDKTKKNDVMKSLLKKKNSSLKDIFKDEEYLSTFKSNDQAFYKKLFSTKMFYEFIAKRYIQNSTEESLNILLFDEFCIVKKNKKIFAKKIETNYLESKLFSEIEEEYKVPKAKDFSDEEKNTFLKSDLFNSAIKYFQIININPSTNEDNKSHIVSYYAYPVFPKLLYDNTFFDNEAYELILIKNNLQINDSLNNSYNVLCMRILEDEKYMQIYKSNGYSFSKNIMFFYSY